MPISMRVLSDDDRARVHEQSLAVLAKTGMRIDSERARRILGEAGAQVDEADRRVRFPRALVEAALAAAPKQFSLGGRRPGFALPMNAGECTLIPDGESTMFYDPVTGVRRVATREDWVAATKLVDTMDEVGAYWQMVTAGEDARGIGALVAHLVETFRLFSKHVQDAPGTVEEAAWLLELLAAIFGGREAVRRDHPYSVLYCPVSPLAMEEEHTDAYLATVGWDIPIAIMPMPMMGTSAPTGLRSTVVSGNAEVLGAICLVQAASPGTPVIYAPALAAMEPRTGRWGGGSPEHSLLGAATTEMGRFYGLPVTSSNGGTDHFVDRHPVGLRADDQLGPAGALVAGHPDRARVARRRVHALPGADGHRRGDLPDVAPHPGAGSGTAWARRTWSRRWTRWARSATSSAGRPRGTPSAAASSSCRSSGTTAPSTAGRPPAGRTSWTRPARRRRRPSTGTSRIPFPDEVAAELARLEQRRARRRRPSGSGGRRCGTRRHSCAPTSRRASTRSPSASSRRSGLRVHGDVAPAVARRRPARRWTPPRAS